ncbi:MAG: diaminopimelate dehydrogenase [Candidatus Pacebacteria bacterium]|nr:diaminopimelate dehydrogenase [Candidatus Paceibacterota bacterium]
MEQIRVGIVGYGNLGRGVKLAIEKNPDMKLSGIISRRPEAVKWEVRGEIPTHFLDFSTEYTQEDFNVVILCGGSRKDIPRQGPYFAKYFNTVDSFDTHKRILWYRKKMEEAANPGAHTSIISAGWDPGIFSLERMLGSAFLPGSKTYTFWGQGVSQGHSDAARRVKGVVDARAYTQPIGKAIDEVRSGFTPELTKRQMHRRLVYVEVEKGADERRIEKEIKTMPDYFDEYETAVYFVGKESMAKDHKRLPHGGFVLTSGKTSETNRQILEYRCALESNPEFTASVLVACARAACRMNKEQMFGAYTLADFPLAFLSPHTGKAFTKKFW